MKHPLIYLDNAATTFPKPPSVVNEVMRCMTNYCGNPGRSGHALSLEASKKIYECREGLARMFGISNPTNIVFTPNTTYALNIAVSAFARKKTHILISDMEHNSVLRTVNSLTKQGIEYDIFRVDPYDKQKTLLSIKQGLRSNTSLIVCTHVSNICGIALPIYEIGLFCKKMGLKFIVDGAQSAGTHKIDVEKDNIDALCCPGHKGLYGPQGTGFIVFSDKYSEEKIIKKLSPFIYGGNGVNSADIQMPDILPERFEGGTLNTPAIAGLCEGVRFVADKTEEAIFDHTCRLYRRALDMISTLPETTVYCGELPQSSCLLFNINGMDSDTVADLLNDNGICVRAGLHCAPLAHKKLKTLKGAVRVSFSCFNTLTEPEYLYSVLKNIIFTK